MSSRVRLRVKRSPRDPAVLPPADDHTLGMAVWDRLAATLAKGRPRPALVVVREATVEQFDLVELSRTVGPATPRLVAALAAQIDADRQTTVQCTALVGALRLHKPGRPPQPAAVVFVEWPDGRWWTAHAPLAAEGGIQWPAPVVRAAVDGWPRPGGVGGWFAQARRERLVLRLEATVPDAPQQGLGLVH